MRNRNMKNKKSKKKKINKKRLFLFLVLIFTIVFLLGKGLVTVKNIIFTKQVIVKDDKNKEEKNKEEKNIKNVINIVIDPEKGGTENGQKSYNGQLLEKDINLDIAKLVKNYLSQESDVQVFMTRSYDDTISMKDRLSLAKKQKADIFVSIRVNAQTNSNEASGLDTYYSGPMENPSLVLKDKEKNTSNLNNKNEKEISKNVDNIKSEKKNSESNSEIEKEQENRKNLSKSLADSVQKMTVSFIGMKDRGINDKAFNILKYTDMPSIIVQCGFISNKYDSEKLESESGREAIAQGISQGILNFIDNNREKLIKNRLNYSYDE